MFFCDTVYFNVTIKLSINSKSLRHSKQMLKMSAICRSESGDPDCGGAAAAHYGGVGTPRPVCH